VLSLDNLNLNADLEDILDGSSSHNTNNEPYHRRKRSSGYDGDNGRGDGGITITTSPRHGGASTTIIAGTPVTVNTRMNGPSIITAAAAPSSSLSVHFDEQSSSSNITPSTSRGGGGRTGGTPIAAAATTPMNNVPPTTSTTLVHRRPSSIGGLNASIRSSFMSLPDDAVVTFDIHDDDASIDATYTSSYYYSNATAASRTPAVSSSPLPFNRSAPAAPPATLPITTTNSSPTEPLSNLQPTPSMPSLSVNNDDDDAEIFHFDVSSVTSPSSTFHSE
jgi:hypothetical protein